MGDRAAPAGINNETCEDTPANAYKCFIGGPSGNGTEPSTITGLNAHKLTLGIDCQAEPEQECITGASQYDVWAAMYGATVTINDPTPPTLTTPTGSLWETSEHNGYHTGTESLTTSAQDIGGGIQTIILTVDEKPLQTYTATCDFTYPQPCPTTTGSQTFTVATPELADGPHTLTVIAVDAAGNDSTIVSDQITVANNPPSAPKTLTAIATQPGSNTYLATWTDPIDQPVPVTSATYQLCPKSTPAECAAPIQAPVEGPAIVTLPSPGTWILAVWLTNAAGFASPNDAATTQIMILAPPGPGMPSVSPSTKNASPPLSSFLLPSLASQIKAGLLRMSAHIRGQRLFARLSGLCKGRVHITYALRYRNKTIGHASKIVSLRHGPQTVRFRLPRHSKAQVAVVLTARLVRSNAYVRVFLPRRRR